jgi:hypothetical protein
MPTNVTQKVTVNVGTQKKKRKSRKKSKKSPNVLGRAPGALLPPTALYSTPYHNFQPPWLNHHNGFIPTLEEDRITKHQLLGAPPTSYPSHPMPQSPSFTPPQIKLETDHVAPRTLLENKTPLKLPSATPDKWIEDYHTPKLERSLHRFQDAPAFNTRSNAQNVKNLEEAIEKHHVVKRRGRNARSYDSD